MLRADRLPLTVPFSSRPASDSAAQPLWLLTPITPAEDRVLQLLRRGASNRSIATELVLSPRTVESHVSSLLAKTGCRSRSQLLLWTLSHSPATPCAPLHQP